ncbi:MAG: hypothetical protein IJU07_00270 [Synergistaceae bacterium]|nr:hypothetical protein [Synergistaceae bacterium]
MQFTACYRKLEHGYMGKLLEWPGVITEGEDLDDCRECLIDAATGMAIVYRDDGREIPQTALTIETLSIPLEDDSFLSTHGEYHDVLANAEGKFVTLKQAEEFDDYTVKELCREAGIPDIFQTQNREDNKL